MPEQSIIAWDLETVPDLAAAARMLDLGNAADADVRQALARAFPSILSTRLFASALWSQTGL
jgi:hypothetical protein